MLERVLGARVPPTVDMENCEEVTAHDVDMEQEIRQQQQRAQEAYDEDEVSAFDTRCCVSSLTMYAHDSAHWERVKPFCRHLNTHVCIHISRSSIETQKSYNSIQVNVTSTTLVSFRAHAHVYRVLDMQERVPARAGFPPVLTFVSPGDNWWNFLLGETT